MSSERAVLPRHDEMGLLTRLVEVACLIAAAVLLVTQVVRLARTPGIRSWSSLAIVLAAMVAADFVSGLVHWIADTWGSETMPVLGRRFLRPFRVHHVHPEDFLRRDFVDCNGDVAMINLPILAGALLAPSGSALALFLTAFAAAALPTNQVHQWAHRPAPPAPVRLLQRWSVVLGRPAHALHHVTPYAVNYCIATGWCNRPLAAIGFFPALERVVERWTGARPRRADELFAAEVERAARGAA